MCNETTGDLIHTTDAATSPQVEAVRSTFNNPRARYLLGHLGLSHDPFRYSVAEQEVRRQPNQFFVYSADSSADLLMRLEQQEHSVVFAPAGGGKTTLRLNLAHRLRRDKPSILPVTYRLTDIETLDAWHVEQSLLLEFAKDLLIALYRQDNIARGAHLAPQGPSARLVAWLLHHATYRRTLRRLLDMPDSKPVAPLWRLFGRLGTPRTAWTSPALRQFTLSLLELPQVPDYSPSWQDAPSILAELGFQKLYLLVDSVDAVERSQAQMGQMLLLLLGGAPVAAPWFTFKLFLPVELERVMQSWFDALPDQVAVQEHHLTWTDAQLEQVLLQRLRAAHSKIESVQDVFEHAQAERICRELLGAAHGSPREMFRLLSATIDQHVARERRPSALNDDDWRDGRRIHPSPYPE